MQKTKYERLKEVLPINIGDSVYYCSHDPKNDTEMPYIPYLCVLQVIGILQAPEDNEDCDPIFILYDPITNRAHVRMAVWERSMALQTVEMVNNPELCASIVRQYESVYMGAYHV